MRLQKKIEKIYFGRVRTLMNKTGKNLGKAFVIRSHRSMEPWNEPAGAWIFRISQE